jgi:hypothetical protein
VFQEIGIYPVQNIEGVFFVYQKVRFLSWYHFGIFDSLKKKTVEFGVLNICDVILVCVPVDLSILVIWRIVLPAVARLCENFEIHKTKHIYEIIQRKYLQII